MKTINMDTWGRKTHFEFFQGMDYPQFNICMNMDITKFHSYTKSCDLSFYFCMIHAASRAANETTEFRYRIRGNQVVLHETVHPSFTYMQKDSDLFRIVTAEMKDDMTEFAADAKARAKKQEAYFDNGDHSDDLLYITCIPWISFTSLSHTIALRKDDSAPRISWGKYFRDGGRVMLPFSVQVNHALMDGLHVARYISRLEEAINSYE